MMQKSKIKKKDLSELIMNVSFMTVLYALAGPETLIDLIGFIVLTTIWFIAIKRFVNYSMIRINYAENGHPIWPIFRTRGLQAILFSFVAFLLFALTYPVQFAFSFAAIVGMASMAAQEGLFFLEKKRFEEESARNKSSD